MTLSFRARLFVTYALVVVAALATVTALIVREQRRELEQAVLRTLDADARAVAARLPAQADWTAVAARHAANIGRRVTLIGRDGRVVADSDVGAGLGALENHAGRPEVRAALRGVIGHAVRRSHTLGRDLAYAAVPAPPGHALAVVRVAAPVRAIGSAVSALLRLSSIAALVTFLLSIPLLFWVTGRDARRVGTLERVALQMAAGDTGARAPEGSQDELGRLGRAINHMAAQGRVRLETLERERDERERILAHMTDGVALIDPAGAVLRMNRSFAALLGQPLPAEAGTPFHAFARAPELDTLMRSARAERHALETDLRLWLPGQRLVHATATPLGGANREAVLLVLHDLSEAERLNRVRQDFVANVSHELRTPLTSLRGYAETLLEGGLDDAEHRESFVRVIHDQAVRLEALAEDLLTLAQLERPGARPRLEAFDLRELAARQVAAFAQRAESAGLALGLDAGPEVPVTADRGLMEQVIANLLDNALKYTDRGRVRIRVATVDGRAVCEVEDTGAGIPEEDQPRIFERFYRVDRARSRQKGGTGLGLSIVRHILSLHGGEVALSSRPGEGSTFRFEIPVAPVAAPAG